MKTLNVIKTSASEIRMRRGFTPYMLMGSEVFIRCNQKAEIRWDIAPIYTWAEIKSEQKRREVHFLVPKEIFTIHF